MRTALTLATLLLLAGCNRNEAITQASSPPLLLGERDVHAIITPGMTDLEVSRALASLGDPRGVHAVLNTADPRLAARVASALARNGIDPSRIRTIADPKDMVVLRVFTLALPDCAAALRPSWFGDVSGSMTALGQCTSARALAEELSDPGDLVSPAHLGFANGARFARVVELWEAGGDHGGHSGGSGSGGGSGGGGSGEAGSNGGPPSAPIATSGTMQAPPQQGGQSGGEDNPLLSGAPVTSGDRSE